MVLEKQYAINIWFIFIATIVSVAVSTFMQTEIVDFPDFGNYILNYVVKLIFLSILFTLAIVPATINVNHIINKKIK